MDTTANQKQQHPPSAEEALELRGTISQKPDPVSGDCWDTDGGRSLNNSAGEHASRTENYSEGDKLADNTVKSKCGHEDDSKVAQDDVEGQNRLLDDRGTVINIPEIASDGTVMNAVPLRGEEGSCGGRVSTNGNGHILNAARPEVDRETNPNVGTASLPAPSHETTVATEEGSLVPQGLCPGMNIPTDTSTRANRQVQECWTCDSYKQKDEYDKGQKKKVGEGVPGLRGGADEGDGDMKAQGTGTQAARSLSQGIGEAREGGAGGGGDGTYVTGEPSLLTRTAAIERRHTQRPRGE